MAVTPEQLAQTLLHRAATKQARHQERALELRRRLDAWARAGHARGDFQAAWLIGSLARGAWGDASDVDVVLEGLTRPEGATWSELCELLDASVDLLPLEGLPPDFAERVRREGVRLA